MPRRLAAVLLAGFLGVSAVSAASSASWVSGGGIPVGTAEGRGPLSVGLNNHPVGAAFIHGGERPDLFVAAGRWSSDPGLFLFRWMEDDGNGVPVFGERRRISHPGGSGIPPEGVVFQTEAGAVYGFWLIGGELVKSTFDPVGNRFTQRGGPVSLAVLPRAPERVTVLENADGSLEVVFSVTDGTRYRPPAPPGHRDPDYRPFDGAGIWRGSWPYAFLMAGRMESPMAAELENARVVSATEREARLTMGNVTPVRLGEGRERDIVTGSRFGNFHYYRNDSSAGIILASRRLVNGETGVAMRHPTVRPTPVAYPDRETGFSNLIAGGEGALYYYRFNGFDARGSPVYAEPLPVTEAGADLYAGSLPVLTVVDWNGDGSPDLVAGNSEGRVLFFRNAGTAASPAMAPPVGIGAGGRAIHLQQRYSGIQGPGEARWGYACPTVTDWSGNGLPDILMSSATQRHKVFLNTGSASAPGLEESQPLYWKGLDMHGTWRVQPAVAKLGERMAYVVLDADDEFRLYWRIDDFNLEDGGKLLLEDGSPIGANYLAAGGTGRLKLVFADWDGNGLPDLVVGTPRHASVPNPETGLPQSKGLPGAAVLRLRNVGTVEEPVFAFPEEMRFRGEPRYFGQHACSPAVARIGAPGGPHLLVGTEEGRVYFFNRSDVTWGDGGENGVEGFEAWRREHFSPGELEDPSVSGPEARLEGGNLSNLLKYAIGSGPRETPAPESLPALDVSTGSPVVTYQRRGWAPDVDYHLEFSGNLTDWNTNGDWVEQLVIEDQGEFERVTVFARMGPRFFFRLRVVWSGTP